MSKSLMQGPHNSTWKRFFELNLSVSRKSARSRFQEGKLFSRKFVSSINKTI